MKFVRGAAVIAGLADLAFAALFILKPSAFHPDMDPRIYAQWVGLALLASAVSLFIVASDPERYLPVLFVNIGARTLAALFTIIYITHFTLFISILPSHGGIVAILVAALVFEMKPRFEGKKKAQAEKKPAAGKPGAKPVERPATKKPAPARPASQPAQQKPAVEKSEGAAGGGRRGGKGEGGKRSTE